MNAEDMRAMIEAEAITPLPTPIRPVTELPVGEPLRYTPPVAPGPRRTWSSDIKGAMLPTRPLEPPPPAPVTPPPAPPTMPPVAPVAPTKQALLNVARDAQIPTAGTAGVPFDKALLNFARKYVDPELQSLMT